MRKIPTHLDDPPQLFFWEFDDFIILSVMFSIGILADHLGMLLIGGLLLVRLFQKHKDGQANGYLLHVLYWNTGTNGLDKFPTSIPLSFIKQFH